MAVLDKDQGEYLNSDVYREYKNKAIGRGGFIEYTYKATGRHGR